MNARTLSRSRFIRTSTAVAAALAASPPCWAQSAAVAANPVAAAASAPQKSEGLTEVVVTARKSSESMQKAPLAISVLSAAELEAKGIANLGDFMATPSPFLRIIPYAGNPALPLIGIRGLSTDDPGQASNEPAVGVYVDGVYMARAQGSLMELAEIAQIEILRGPQGTLFGRNALGGAVNVATRKPTGELGFSGTLETGSYGLRKGVAHLDLPAMGGLRIKIDALKSQRGGTVKNREAGQWDFGQYDRSGYRFDALFDAIPDFTARYSYDDSRDRTAFGYSQRITGGALSPLPLEPQRVNISQTPEYLQPSATDTRGHLLDLAWNVDRDLTFKSITSYRSVDYASNENYPNFFVWVPLGGTQALSGFASRQDDQQNQISQEFQLVGNTDLQSVGKIKYATGIFLFRERVDDRNDSGSTVFDFAGGFGDPAAAQILVPYQSFSGGAGNCHDRLEARSQAAYRQASWQPLGLDDRLELTLGLRYTRDHKEGTQLSGVSIATPPGRFDLNSGHVDRNVTASYALSEGTNAYVRNATGYRGGGVSLRDPEFVPFSNDTAQSWEIGTKSEFWTRKARLNMAVYETTVKNMRASYANVAVTRLFNAQGNVNIRGFESELTVQPTPDLTLSGSYTYTQVDFPDQVIPAGFPGAGGAKSFTLAQAPRNAGSLAIDWDVAHFGGITLTSHLDGYWTSSFVTVPQLVNQPVPGYCLFNGRLTLKNIAVGKEGGSFKVSAWVKNLADRKYKDFSMNDPADNAVIMQYGEPRTFGVGLSYEY